MANLHPHQRRQLAIFVAAILVPSAALVLVSWQTLRQYRELAGKRSDDQRRADTARIARDLLDRLETIKQHAAASPNQPPDPAVALVARREGGRMLPPWESDAAALRAKELEQPGPFRSALDRGIQAESAGDLNTAVRSYGQAMEAASGHAVAENYASVLMAVVLKRQGRAKEAEAAARSALASPPDAVDEDGVPLAVHAAGVLLDSPEDRAAVRSALDAALAGRRLHSHMAANAFSRILDQLHDPEWAQSFRRRLDAIDASQEQAGAIENGDVVPPEGRRWLYQPGKDPWLVSATPAMVVAVRARDFLQPIESAADLRFQASFEPGGQPFADAFPGLAVRFPAPAGDPRPSGAGALYFAALGLLVLATAFGASVLWRSLRREVELAETRSRFVASVSHELKTPLTAIRMFAETLEMGRAAGEDERREYLETISRESERLSRLVDDVLLFSKIEQGKAVFRFRPISLADPVEKAARTLSYPLAQHGFTLQSSLDEDLPIVEADSDALEQAVLNLLTNAMKYSGERKEIELRLARQGADAVIQVTDHGVGIAPEDLPHLFEEYYRAPSAENRTVPGTGLGLTLVAQIARAHGGDVDVKSTPGAGSTFTIRLPLERRKA